MTATDSMTYSLESSKYAKFGNDVRIYPVSHADVSAIAVSDFIPEKLRLDMFNKDGTNFCGWLDIYFNDRNNISNGNLCFSDFRPAPEGKWQAKCYDLPFEAIFGPGNVPKAAGRRIVDECMNHAVGLHKSDIGNWTDLDVVPEQRVSPEILKETLNVEADGRDSV